MGDSKCLKECSAKSSSMEKSFTTNFKNCRRTIVYQTKQQKILKKRLSFTITSTAEKQSNIGPKKKQPMRSTSFLVFVVPQNSFYARRSQAWMPTIICRQEKQIMFLIYEIKTMAGYRPYNYFCSCLWAETRA
jgi:hypothetical protein